MPLQEVAAMLVAVIVGTIAAVLMSNSNLSMWIVFPSWWVIVAFVFFPLTLLLSCRDIPSSEGDGPKG
jgi:uncharacterized protein (DUF983 family)